MEDNHRGARSNVSSYPKLIEFYEGVLANKATSLRTRMSAAKQLDAILTRMERREAAEGRRLDRARVQAAKAQQQALQQQPIPEDLAANEVERQREAAVRRGVEHLEKLLQKSF